MTTLSKRTRRRLRVACRDGDKAERKEARQEAVEYELRRWTRSPHGRYGLLTEAECAEWADGIVHHAWKKLREIAGERITDVMDDYEEQAEGPPRFDLGGEVDSQVGGNTRTSWRSWRDGFVQTGSGRILVGSKYLCRRKRSAARCVTISVMKTLVHELMGHWNQVGQRIPVRPDLSERARRSRRKARAERRADRVTATQWSRLRRSSGFERCLEACDDDFARRAKLARKRLRRAVKDYCRKR